MRLYQINPKAVLQFLRTELELYINTHKLKSLVLGVSGGIDSAVVAAIAAPVCNKLGVHLIGISLPSETNKEEEIIRADKIGRAYCSDFHTIYIDKQVKMFTDGNMALTTPQTKEDKIRRGNIKARVRMIHLYDWAQGCHGCVLSTDNLTELYLGFWTLHGDVGDIGMIQNLWKTDVYRLSQYIADTETNIDKKEALQLCIDAIPTDGLGITSSDLEQIGAVTYEEVDDILSAYINHNDMTNVEHPIIKRYKNTDFKRNNPYNFEIPYPFENDCIKFKINGVGRTIL